MPLFSGISLWCLPCLGMSSNWNAAGERQISPGQQASEGCSKRCREGHGDVSPKSQWSVRGLPGSTTFSFPYALPVSSNVRTWVTSNYFLSEKENCKRNQVNWFARRNPCSVGFSNNLEEQMMWGNSVLEWKNIPMKKMDHIMIHKLK